MEKPHPEHSFKLEKTTKEKEKQAQNIANQLNSWR
jgi:hypothetical protein